MFWLQAAFLHGEIQGLLFPPSCGPDTLGVCFHPADEGKDTVKNPQNYFSCSLKVTCGMSAHTHSHHINTWKGARNIVLAGEPVITPHCGMWHTFWWRAGCPLWWGGGGGTHCWVKPNQQFLPWKCYLCFLSYAPNNIIFVPTLQMWKKTQRG